MDNTFSNPLKIMSSFKGYDELLKSERSVTHEYIGQEEALFTSLKIALRAMWSADFLIFNNDHRRLLVTCALFALFAPRPFRSCRLISVDLILRPEKGWTGRLKIAVKSVLFRQVDSFLLYFKNWDGYISTYRLPRERMEYVPFKVNSWESLVRKQNENKTEDYVLCAGATFRDHETFIEAVRASGVPAVLLLPGNARKEMHRYEWSKKELPPHLRVEFHDDGLEETYLGYFSNARMVCLPRFKWDIASTGISACLYSMALEKCVVISRGPGADDILDRDRAAEFFEPENPVELAEILKNLWTNGRRRRQIALNGYHYATRLQGEARLLRDILDTLEYVRASTTEYA